MNKLRLFSNSQTINWRYFLIIVIFIFILGGVIVKQYQTTLHEIQRSQVSLENSKDIAQNKISVKQDELSPEEKVSIFKDIFPDGITGEKIDSITDIKEKAEIFFEKSIVKYEDLDGTGADDLFIIAQWPIKCNFLNFPGSWPYTQKGDIKGYLKLDYNITEGGWFEFPEEWFTQKVKSPRLQISPNEDCYFDTPNPSYTLIINFSQIADLFPTDQALAEERFQPLVAYNQENKTLQLRIDQYAITIKLFGYDVVVQRSEKWVLYPIPKIGPLYILRRSNEGWDFVDLIDQSFYRSGYEIGKIKHNGLADIVYRHSLSAGSYTVILYKWNGAEYIKEGKGVCDLKAPSSEACSYITF